MVFIGESMEEAIQAYEKWKIALEDQGLKVNERKTKKTCVQREVEVKDYRN